MRSKTRWTLAGLMALAALAAVGVFGVAPATADAAPSVSPFAGTYVGWDPHEWRWDPWTVTISDKGWITSPWPTWGGSMSGRVSADGSYSLTVSFRYPRYDDGTRPGGGRKWDTLSYDSTGIMALDADGNIVGTELFSPQYTYRASFFWLRQ